MRDVSTRRSRLQYGYGRGARCLAPPPTYLRCAGVITILTTIMLLPLRVIECQSAVLGRRLAARSAVARTLPRASASTPDARDSERGVRPVVPIPP